MQAFYCSLIQTTKVQQFGETKGVAEKKNDDYSIAVETSINYCSDLRVEHNG
jgi:hypothetical protein